jgi:hypothetical protein
MAQKSQPPAKLNELTSVKFVQFQVISNPPQVTLFALDSNGQIWMNLSPQNNFNWVPLSTPINSQLFADENSSR